ncbi:MAG: hypothetical protein AAF673_00045 [Pseudomonadota bacterium]
MLHNIAFIGPSSVAKDSITKMSDIIHEIILQLDSEKHCVLVGAGNDFSYYVSSIANQHGLSVIGMSPYGNIQEHWGHQSAESSSQYRNIVCTGLGFKGRNVVLIRSAEAVVSIGGNMGTLNELTIAYDEGKIINLRINTSFIGPATDTFATIYTKFKTKSANTKIIDDPDNKISSDKMLDMLKTNQ